jgi:transcription elongation factor Elf1
MSNKINPGAYQGDLNCPCCQSKAIRFVEKVTPMRLRYRCRKCGIKFQYDISNRQDINPYAAYSTGSRFSQTLRRFLGGRTLKGGIIR